MKKRHEAAIIAANWWAKKIASDDPHENGDKSEASILAMALVDYGRKKPTEEQLNTFWAEVVKGIEEFPYDCEIDLYCDYGPGFILKDAANKAGIDHHNFPFKTGMRVSENEVRVKEGYGKPYSVLWRKIDEHTN